MMSSQTFICEALPRRGIRPGRRRRRHGGGGASLPDARADPVTPHILPRVVHGNCLDLNTAAAQGIALVPLSFFCLTYASP